MSPDLAIFVANDRLTKPIPAHTRILHGGSVCLAVLQYMYTYIGSYCWGAYII